MTDQPRSWPPSRRQRWYIGALLGIGAVWVVAGWVDAGLVLLAAGACLAVYYWVTPQEKRWAEDMAYLFGDDADSGGRDTRYS